MNEFGYIQGTSRFQVGARTHDIPSIWKCWDCSHMYEDEKPQSECPDCGGDVLAAPMREAESFQKQTRRGKRKLYVEEDET